MSGAASQTTEINNSSFIHIERSSSSSSSSSSGSGGGGGCVRACVRARARVRAPRNVAAATVTCEHSSGIIV